MGKYCKLFQTLYNFFSILLMFKLLISIPKFNRQLLAKNEKKAFEQQELVKNKTKLIKEQKTRLQMGSALNIGTTTLW